MLELRYSSQFKRDLKACAKRGLNLELLQQVIDTLAVPSPLADEETFRGVYIDYGVPVWRDGEIDISPEKLYADGEIA